MEYVAGLCVEYELKELVNECVAKVIFLIVRCLHKNTNSDKFYSCSMKNPTQESWHLHVKWKTCNRNWRRLTEIEKYSIDYKHLTVIDCEVSLTYLKVNFKMASVIHADFFNISMLQNL